MSDNASFSQNMDTIFADLHDFVKSDSVLGAPVVVGDKTLVPVISVTLGYGSPGSSNNNASASSGMGARISTSAVVVIEKNSATMLTVGEKANMSQMIDKIPEALASVSQGMKGQQPAQPQQGGQQNQQPAPPAK